MKNNIQHNVKNILDELPENIKLVAAAKTRTADDILQAIEAGVKIIGENYIQEAMNVFEVIGKKVNWHFIGHLQRNKAKYAVKIFDMIETVDSFPLASEIDKQCRKINKIIPVLIEINSGREIQKAGVLPEDTEDLIALIASLEHIKIKGLMTMGPYAGDPEDARPYFIETRKLFNHLKKQNLPQVEMRYLSMGMTNSYQVAIQEGANIVRIGTKIFGPR